MAGIRASVNARHSGETSFSKWKLCFHFELRSCELCVAFINDSCRVCGSFFVYFSFHETVKRKHTKCETCMKGTKRE